MAACGTNVIYVGGRPSVQMTFTDVDDQLADPGSILVKVLKPDMTTATYNTPDGSISQDSTGVWVFQFPAGLDLSGTYWVYMVGSGGGADAASEIKLLVHGSHVP